LGDVEALDGDLYVAGGETGLSNCCGDSGLRGLAGGLGRLLLPCRLADLGDDRGTTPTTPTPAPAVNGILEGFCVEKEEDVLLLLLLVFMLSLDDVTDFLYKSVSWTD